MFEIFYFYIYLFIHSYYLFQDWDLMNMKDLILRYIIALDK